MAQRNSSIFSTTRVFIGAGLVLLGSVATMSWVGGSEAQGTYSAKTAGPEIGPAIGPAIAPIEDKVAPPSAPEPAVADNDDMSVKVSFDQSLVSPQARDATAMIEVTVPEQRDRVRRGAAIAIVIDRSGSMKGNKMDNAKRAAHGLVDRLSDGDRVSVVSFNAEAQTHLANFELGDDRSDAHAAIDTIVVKGNTCMSCGMSEAYEALSRAPTGHGRRVVLLSDGEANRGDQSSEALGDLANGGLTEFRVATATVGIGEGFDTEIMRTISERGTGGYYFVHNSKGIGDVLAREADSLTGVVADNVQVRVTPIARGVSLRDGNYGRIHLVSVGQMSDGESRRLIVPLELSGDLGEVIEVETSYVDPDGTKRVLVARATMLRSDDAVAADKSMDPSVGQEKLRQSTPDEVEAALDAYDHGDTIGATVQLEAQANRLEIAASASPSPDAPPAKALQREANEVRSLAARVRKHKSSSKAAVITRRLNDARNSEVRRGKAGDDMFYDGEMGNAGARPASELE